MVYHIPNMKKALIFVFFLLGLGFSVPLAQAQNALGSAQAGASVVQGGERIRDFKVTATLDSERLLTVREQITYDFGAAQKHGIFRDIPESYKRNGMSYNYRYHVTSVQRDGKDEPYEQSRSKDNLHLKIGSANLTITGQHTYVIEYQSSKVINFFSDRSELYWNVTGNGWQVPIDAASLTLASPLKAEKPQDFICYTGVLGSTENACKLQAKNDSLEVVATRTLQPSEGMTVVFAFPLGLIKQPTSSDLFRETVRDNLILLVPLLFFALMFYVWRKRGKDLPNQTIIPHYEAPRKLSPLILSGGLGNGTLPSRGVTATIIDMARKGYLHIEYGTEKHFFGDKQTYTFVKKKTPGDEALDWERILWNALFLDGAREKTTFDDLKKDEFYRDVNRVNTAGNKVLQSLHIFDANPYLVRTLYMAGAIVAATVVLVVGVDAPASGIAAVATFAIVAIFGWFMPRRTQDGVNLVAEIKGFKWFLSVTEEERLKFHNAPARTPDQFMSLLPAAIALGVEKQWAEQFKDLQIAPPDWAEGNLTNWNSLAIATAVTQMNTASAATVYSPPASTAGSGGSGFSGGGSGGGGGGGGGGSW